MTKETDALAALHQQLIDARKGYEEGVRLADDPETVEIFRDLHDLHRLHAEDIGADLAGRGEAPDADGSYMALVHKAVLNVRSAMTGLEASALPGVIDGEKRILDAYDETLAGLPAADAAREMLTRQRGALAGQVDLLSRRQATA